MAEIDVKALSGFSPKIFDECSTFWHNSSHYFALRYEM